MWLPGFCSHSKQKKKLERRTERGERETNGSYVPSNSARFIDEMDGQAGRPFVTFYFPILRPFSTPFSASFLKKKKTGERRIKEQRTIVTSSTLILPD